MGAEPNLAENPIRKADLFRAVISLFQCARSEPRNFGTTVGSRYLQWNPKQLPQRDSRVLVGKLPLAGDEAPFFEDLDADDPTELNHCLFLGDLVDCNMVRVASDVMVMLLRNNAGFVNLRFDDGHGVRKHRIRLSTIISDAPSDMLITELSHVLVRHVFAEIVKLSRVRK